MVVWATLARTLICSEGEVRIPRSRFVIPAMSHFLLLDENPSLFLSFPSGTAPLCQAHPPPPPPPRRFFLSVVSCEIFSVLFAFGFCFLFLFSSAVFFFRVFLHLSGDFSASDYRPFLPGSAVNIIPSPSFSP